MQAFYNDSRRRNQSEPGAVLWVLRHLYLPLSLLLLLSAATSSGQLATPAQVAQPKAPPKFWVDKDTGHRVIRLTDERNSDGLYFDENAYTPDGLDMIYTSPKGIHDLNLATFQSVLLVAGNHFGDIVIGKKTRRVFYKDYSDGHYYAIDIDTRQATRLPRLPTRAHISTVNADETLLAGTFLEGKSSDLVQYRLGAYAASKPALDAARQADANATAALDATLQSVAAQSQALSAYRAGATATLDDAKAKMSLTQSNVEAATVLTGDARAKEQDAQAQLRTGLADAAQKRFDSRAPEDLFTLNLQTGEIRVILKGTDWLNHVQFSPTDPTLLLYDHEGPALQVDRVWTIRTDGSHNVLMHKRDNPAAIATHEFWSGDGKTIWFDLQETKGETFAVAGVDVATGKRTVYRLKKQEASLHYNIAPDNTVFCGDGNLTAHGEIGVNGHRTFDRAWIELLRPFPDGSFHTTRLAHISGNNYQRTEPNPRFTPDKKMVIFTSNMLGYTYIFGVEVAKTEFAGTAAGK